MKNGAVIYCRVSTEEQSENNSLPYQLKVCREAAKRLSCKILHEFREEESGAKQDRTEMMKMLKFCTQNRNKIQYVIVKDIDRFSRDTYIHLFWRQQFRSIGIELFSVNQPSIADGTAEAQLTEGIFSVFAQFERSKILERRFQRGDLARRLDSAVSLRLPVPSSGRQSADLGARTRGSESRRKSV
jgi:site-specific DNA recombinase